MKLAQLAPLAWLRARRVEAAPAIDQALALEANRGLALAIRARLAAFVAIGLWLALAIPRTFTLFHHAFIILFIVLGLLQLGLLRSRHARPWQAYLFAGLDGVLLALVLLMPNPLLDVQPPPALVLNYANIIFYFVVLAGAALTLSPMLVLWTALSAMLCWGLGVALIVALPEVVTEREPPFATATSLDETIRAFLAPNFVHTNIQIKKAFVVLLVAAILAVVVARARRIVYRQAAAERERTNLARYFSPNLVPALAARGQLFDEVRRQPIAILFTDIKGFTTLCERLPPEAVVELLRALHQRLSGCVFDHAGTLDKFTGDGLMATFGTPDPADDDATRALACARAMLDVVDRLNAERAAAGKFTIELGIGVHYGLVVQGDISGGQRLDFTVLGDAVNVAARLERATRDLNARLIVSQAVVDRMHLEQAAPDLSGLEPRGPLPVRGRLGLLEVWALGVPLSSAPEVAGDRRLGPASA
jgi:adenylate cyclase